jgi:plasmid stabilization system protein ParE
MSYELVLQSEAIIEIQKAFEWYEHRTTGLGYEFIGELEDGFERLSKHPHHYSAINRKYRKLRIKRFPYLIVFEIEEDKVVINSVKHIGQEPKR